jgi:hypothetical protein
MYHTEIVDHNLVVGKTVSRTWTSSDNQVYGLEFSDGTYIRFSPVLLSEEEIDARQEEQRLETLALLEKNRQELEDGDHPGFDQYQAAQAPSPVEDWGATCSAHRGKCAMCHGYGECFATYGMQEADRPKS